MARVPAPPTSSVSICVSDEEVQNIREAAIDARLTLSAYCAGAVTASMTNAKTRTATLEAAQRLFASRRTVSRQGRAAMIIPKALEASIKNFAAGSNISAHAYMQAAVLEAMTTSFQKAAPGHMMAVGKAIREKHSVLASVPRETAAAPDLSNKVRDLLDGLRKAIQADQAGPARKGAEAMARRYKDEGDLVTIKVFVPDFELRAIAFCLGIDHNLLLTALAVKAAKRM